MTLLQQEMLGKSPHCTEVVRMLEFYDAPQAFFCKSTSNGLFFFAILVEEGDLYDKWLFAPVSAEVVESKNTPSFHDMIVQSQGVFLVHISDKEPEVITMFDVSSIPPAWIPGD